MIKVLGNGSYGNIISNLTNRNGSNSNISNIKTSGTLQNSKPESVNLYAQQKAAFDKANNSVYLKN